MLAIAFPFGLVGASGMVGMAFGGGLLLGGTTIGLIAALGVLYRIYRVLRFLETLDTIMPLRLPRKIWAVNILPGSA